MKKRLPQTILFLSLMAFSLGVNAQCNKENIMVPTSLNPHNNVGQPKTLVVEAEGVKELKMLLFNRWGTKIFESSSSTLITSDTEVRSVDTGWDGTSLGENLPAGIYVYSMEAQCLDRSTIRKTGTVILTVEKTE